MGSHYIQLKAAVSKNMSFNVVKLQCWSLMKMKFVLKLSKRIISTNCWNKIFIYILKNSRNKTQHYNQLIFLIPQWVPEQIFIAGAATGSLIKSSNRIDFLPERRAEWFYACFVGSVRQRCLWNKEQAMIDDMERAHCIVA